VRDVFPSRNAGKRWDCVILEERSATTIVGERDVSSVEKAVLRFDLDGRKLGDPRTCAAGSCKEPLRRVKRLGGSS